jgi:hypothetical protein
LRISMRKLVGFSGSDSDAQVRILPPQPASPSLTHTKADRARNAAMSQYFPHIIPSWVCDRDRSPGGVPSGLCPFLWFKLLDECSEMRGDGSRQGLVLVFEALPNC